MNNPPLEFHLKLQYSSFKIPVELLRRNFKLAHKINEREFKAIASLNSELISLIEQDSEEATVKFNELITKVDTLEKRMKRRCEYELEVLERIQFRIDNLAQLSHLEGAGLVKWYQNFTNVLIAEHLIRTDDSIIMDDPADIRRRSSVIPGQVSTAPKSLADSLLEESGNAGLMLLKTTGLSKLCDYDILMTATKISNSIKSKNLKPLIQWITDNSAALNKVRSSLEFETRFQEYIELLKNGHVREAVRVYRLQLSLFRETNFEELQLASGLLLYISRCHSNNNKSEKSLRQFHALFYNDTTDNKLDKYMVLLSDKKWHALSELFLEQYYKLYDICKEDPLLIYMSLGISVLKTQSCHSSSSKHRDLKLFPEAQYLQREPCPVCTPEFSDLGTHLPVAHHLKSHLFENPVMTPMGNIFDMERLRMYSRKCGLDKGTISDPIANKTFKADELVTMYPT